jgi:hypothetical protein
MQQNICYHAIVRCHALLYVQSHSPLRITAVEATIGQKCLTLIYWSLLETHDALQRTNAENLKQIFPEKELRGQSSNFHTHVFLSYLYFHTIDLPILLQEICGPILGIFSSQCGDRKRRALVSPPFQFNLELCISVQPQVKLILLHSSSLKAGKVLHCKKITEKGKRN